MVGQEPDPGDLLRFVGSFTDDNHPEVVMMTGGEPLLRPELATEVAQTARRAGTRSALLTGAYFARQSRPPARIMRAIGAVDHFSVSIDAFHERQIPRDDVFRLLRWALDAGVPVSLHVAGFGDDDPYLAELTARARQAFGDQVPMLVNTVRPVGRAAAWLAAQPAPAERRQVLPCAMAAWPVVAHDGMILACCNQTTVDARPAPEHLRLGHIGTDDWAGARARALASPTLRMIRVTGPVYLLASQGKPAAGYCTACRRLGEHPDVIEAVQGFASGAAGALLDRQAARVQVASGPVTLVRRHGCARYAELVALPASEEAA
ncbi:radical SAM protein [Dactylosporangium sp. CA-092794]|uniref:radical SAM protein n=1 Tax=Dactylosporangium sp. CA-092794 TaxID=3239929 RepID=UPI003D9004C3